MSKLHSREIISTFVLPTVTLWLETNIIKNSITNFADSAVPTYNNSFYPFQLYPDKIEANSGTNLIEPDIKKAIDKTRNLRTLENIQKLENDWNGYGAESFPTDVISLSRDIVMILDYQPEIFPTGRQTVQMEYELSDRSYLEIEVYEEKIKIMEVPQRRYSEAKTFELLAREYSKIATVVNNFCGGTSEWEESTTPTMERRYNLRTLAI